MVNDVPWWSERGIKFIEGILKPGMVVFEWGMGGSTIWLSRRVRRVYSMDHNPDWHDKVAKVLKDAQNVILYLASLDDDAYYNRIADIGSEIDLVLIDGRNRVRCFKAAISVVRKSTLLILDDSERGRYSEVFSFPGATVVRRVKADAEGPGRKEMALFRKL